MWRYPFYAFSFLWRIPIGIYPKKIEEFRFALPFFSLVGLSEGFILSLMAMFLLIFIKPQFTALLLLLLLLFVRGIFHLDGLSDTFDALSYKGKGDLQKDREKRLAIMKDSTAGVAGVSAVFLLLLSKFLLISELLEKDSLHLLPLPFFLSRFLLGFVLYCGTPARKDGLGYLMISLFDKKVLAFHLILSWCLLAIYLYVIEKFSFLIHIFLILCLNFLIIVYLYNKFRHAFGGITGDNLGALVEIVETTSLFYLAVLWPGLFS